MKRGFYVFIIFSITSIGSGLHAQVLQDTLPIVDYSQEKDYEIGGVSVVGAEFADDRAITSISGLRVGDKVRIPGPDIPKAIKALWRLRLFTDVQIVIEKTVGDIIFLQIRLQERPRLSQYTYRGVKKGKQETLDEKVERFLLKGTIVTDNIKVNAQEAIQEYYHSKGYLDARVRVLEYPDSSRANSVRLVLDVDRGKKVKIAEIRFEGNKDFTDKKLRKKMKKTNIKRRLFASSKFIADEYKNDKEGLINFYNNQGYRDAKILEDSLWRNEKGDLMIKIDLVEGNPYYFRNITWKGNSIYQTTTLSQVLGIEKGDIYNKELLDKRLSFSEDGRDVSSLYLDNGYLFFRVDPIEVSIEEDSIDLELRIFEGPQATIDKVVIKGNDRTHEHVIRRELRTAPGQKFSRSDIIRSQRQIINLGYFNPETLNINTPVNPQRGTVDIEYTVEEKSSDQLELSAGWGGQGRGVIGTLGLGFNNFSLRKMFKKGAWKPLPMGDGQRLSVRAQTNGRFFQSYSVSFTEPWLGGKKPNSLTVAGFYNRFNYRATGAGFMQIWEVSTSLGTRLKWPDDNFISSTAFSWQRIIVDEWTGNAFQTDDGINVNTGTFNNLSITQTFARSTVADPIFPRSGSRISISLKFTPPYSLFQPNRNYEDETVQEKFKFLEYHKWRFDAEWYTSLIGKLVLKAQAKIGLLGFYDERIGTPPFERFLLGGDGINNQQFGFAGVDIISSRGYEVEDFEANRGGNPTPVFNKYTVELRYPVSLNPSATIFALVFVQGANTWNNLRDFNPFDMRRSAGIGVRAFLPMFGTLGFDYGWGWDKRPGQAIGNFNIVLGFEPE